MAAAVQKRGRDGEAIIDPKTGAVKEFRVVKKPRTEEEGKKQSMVVAEKKGGQLVVSDAVTRTSALMAPTMKLSGHENAVYCVKFNPEGTHLISAGKESTVLLWQVYGECENELIFKGHKLPVVDLAWSRDGEQFFTASADKTAAVFDIQTGQRLKRFRGHDSFVNAVSATRRGDPLVLTGSDDCTAALWDVRQRSHTHLYKHEYQVLSVAFSDDASQVFTAGIDNVVYCWDTRKQEVVYELKGHTDSVTGLRLSPDGNHLLSNAMDNSLRTWDVRPFVAGTTRAVKTYHGHHQDFQKQLLRCSWSPDGSRITCGSADKFVYVWDVESRRILYKLPGHNGIVSEVDFHPKEPIIASCSNDKTIYLGEISTN